MISYPAAEVRSWNGTRCHWDAAMQYVPSDKSISHRLLLFAALHPDPVTIRGLNKGRAVMLLVEALRQLGVDLVWGAEPETLVVRGCLRREGAGERATVYLGPSSAAARLLLGALVGLGIECVVDGDETLRNRPFDWIVDPLRIMGGELEYLGREGALPIAVRRGAFRGGEVCTRIGSAQAVSSLLFAGIAARREVAVTYPVAARDHTQRMAAAFGHTVRERDATVHLVPGESHLPRSITVPADPSALAYVVALFLLINRNVPDAEARFEGVCLNPTRLGFFRWLARCGFFIDHRVESDRGGEPVGTLLVRGGADGALSIAGLDDKCELHSMIDEIPLAVAVGSQLGGRARFVALDELVFKETDRIARTRDLLRHLGVEVEVHGHDIEVCGPQPIVVRGEVPSFGDHRLSMTAHVLLLANCLTARISEGECFRTSFPTFAACMDAILRAEEQ